MFETEVVVKMTGEMFLHAEEARRAAARRLAQTRCRRLRRFCEVTLLAILSRATGYCPRSSLPNEGEKRSRSTPAPMPKAATTPNRLGNVIDS